MTLKYAKISAVIPTFMEEQYIATLLSMLTKAKPKIEVVVVDSKSQDKTYEIAKDFTEKAYQIEERGIAKARNYGASHANGDLIVFLDADVKLPIDFVDKVFETFIDAEVVGATCRIMPEQGTFAERTFFSLYNNLIRITAKFRPHSRGEFLAVRKRKFVKVGGFDESLPCLEDHDLAYRLSKLGRFVFINDLTVYESMRRFREKGFAKVVGTWVIDYVFLMLRGKPLSKVWQPVR